MRWKDNGRFNEVYGKTLLGSHLINGTECRGELSFEVRNPAHAGDCVGNFPQASSEFIEQACRAAQGARASWQGLSEAERSLSFRHLADLLSGQQRFLAQLLARELGQAFPECLSEVQTWIDCAQRCARQERTSLLLPTEVREALQGVSLYLQESRAGMAVIPHLISNLYLGHPWVWLAPSALSATAYVLGRLFWQSGFPAGVCNLVLGADKDFSEYFPLYQQGLVQAFYLLGKADTLAKYSTLALPIQTLVLPEKPSVLVLRVETPFHRALETSFKACFEKNNNRFLKLRRIFVPQSIALAFKQGFLKAIQSLKIGDPSLNHQVDFGPLRMADDLALYLKHLQAGKAEGAELIYGKGRLSRASKPEPFIGDPDAGNYVWPSLWDKVSPEMKFAQADLKGPAVALIEIENHEQALDYLQGSPFQLI
ncbi:hypothetical protein COW36_03925 [bacterium (Candidatus Blackallbacteria) CG17_big_fil_post_rev_8_21_14_2_50_48_46]|uniref:Aldehyde dehydrogenase domain-containing protein n=1 Tax=bacterium (Candidatus Blackallbacteria) CG17_big_fil_post_rev_8_21_14_2_50_48_46 TaxID=2014261 RepID=A0A2M7G8L1_9BACT|nr:MAG: hypothetical protein COW64_05020 [bacterium (Candidatus Blackallbacteria) CG18_big_fil_WC_8_21_14_2_50_49_26]PIW18448.1 MAG: hypothetical protein COW36_03925 [bacterium (Candidatus Blackallbacteria) CG17_big_fil_post_rev_8_21_14_2_50_48_46]PIW46567.1 MAG: hypothetical protein COW20_16755 [bacterium (Candidatus Blackallbacteria) CG13_big_fil_rev_8_21_14_2_50_49_14]